MQWLYGTAEDLNQKFGDMSLDDDDTDQEKTFGSIQHLDSFYNKCATVAQIYEGEFEENLKKNCWWNIPQHNPKQQCHGLLLMRRGEPVRKSDFKNCEGMFAQILQFCMALHAVNLVHRDIRFWNVLRFLINNRVYYQLIDYGFSAPINTRFDVVPSGIYPYAGHDIKLQDCDAKIPWQPKDDIQMLYTLPRYFKLYHKRSIKPTTLYSGDLTE